MASPVSRSGLSPSDGLAFGCAAYAVPLGVPVLLGLRASTLLLGARGSCGTQFILFVIPVSVFIIVGLEYLGTSRLFFFCCSYTSTNTVPYVARLRSRPVNQPLNEKEARREDEEMKALQSGKEIQRELVRNGDEDVMWRETVPRVNENLNRNPRRRWKNKHGNKQK